jgi:NADH dehydrogenase
MLKRDNVADPAMPGLASLGIVPTPIELVVPAYIARYRKGGGKRTEGPLGPDRT